MIEPVEFRCRVCQLRCGCWEGFVWCVSATDRSDPYSSSVRPVLIVSLTRRTGRAHGAARACRLTTEVERRARLSVGASSRWRTGQMSGSKTCNEPVGPSDPPSRLATAADAASHRTGEPSHRRRESPAWGPDRPPQITVARAGQLLVVWRPRGGSSAVAEATPRWRRRCGAKRLITSMCSAATKRGRATRDCCILHVERSDRQANECVATG